jgi:hypothetical protein
LIIDYVSDNIGSATISAAKLSKLSSGAAKVWMVRFCYRTTIVSGVRIGLLSQAQTSRDITLN